MYLPTFFLCQYSFAQVGINTEDPFATLDVTASSGNPLKPEGIIAPRLTGNELKAKDALYGGKQNAAIIFATSAASPTNAV